MVNKGGYGRMISHKRLCVAASLQGPKFRYHRRKKLPVDLGVDEWMKISL